MKKVTTIEQKQTPLPVALLNKFGAWWPSSTIRAVDLIEAAKRRCRLDDFGEGDFFEPLSRLLESCQAEAHLNFIGKMALRADAFRILCNRLLLQRDRETYPEIARQEIRAPLFIVGLPRSGTTILHILLAADPENRVPLSWEVMEPSPPTREHERERIRRAARNFSWLHRLAPTLCRVHAVGAELPQECVTLMSPTFMSDQFDTMYNVPSYRGWFLKQDLTPAYAFHRRFLQHLQHRQGGRRWILKAPAHLIAVKTLLSIYPDARFIQTHRAPVEAVASVSSLITILRRVFSDVVDPREIGQEAMRYWAQSMKIFLQERERLAPERVCDLSYDDIRRDPIAAVRKIYHHFAWPLSPEVETRMKEALAKRPGENGFHRYDTAVFGLDECEESEGWGEYCERFGLSARRNISTPVTLKTDAVADR